MKNYIFYYFMNHKSDLIRQAAPEHSAYWKNIKIHGGPFSDFSGGFVCFSAATYNDAVSTMNKDPFIKAGVLQQHWINEWLN